MEKTLTAATSAQVRISDKAYQLLRLEAFKKHRPMTEVLEAIIIAALKK